MKKQKMNWPLFFLLFITIGQIAAQPKITYTDSLKSSLDTIEKAERGAVYFKIARQYLEYNPQPDSFVHYIHLAKKEANATKDQKLVFNSLYYEGTFEYRSGHFEKALHLLDSAELISKVVNDSLLLGKLYFSKGVMNNRLQNNELFQENILKALNIGRDTKNKILQTSCLVLLSQKSKELGLLDQQYKLLTEANQNFNEISPRSQLNLLIQLSSMYLNRYAESKHVPDRDTASIYINQGIALAEKTGNQHLLTDLWMKQLQLKDINQNIDQQYLDQSQKILDNGIRLKDPFFQFIGYVLKGKALIAFDQPTKALQFKDSIMHYADVLNEPIYYRDAYEVLYKAARNSSNYLRATEYSEQFILYTDSVNSIEKAEMFANAIQKYESEKKEKEILQLSQKQKETEFLARQKEDRLKQQLLGLGLVLIGILFFVYWKQNKQKQKLTQLNLESSLNEQKLLRSQMNPHFLFNSLNSIKRFYIDGRIEEANDFIADFSDLLRQILEQSSKPFISIEEELEFLTLYLELEKRRFKKALNYTIYFDKDKFDFDDQIPSLILQPLVENSIWHGIMKTDRDGEITITIDKVGDDIKCSVTDNGIGFHSLKKSKNHPYTSKGLNLIKERLGPNGRFDIQSIFNEEGYTTGTLATLTFNSSIP